MFFNNASDIEKIAGRCGTAIFVVPQDVEVSIKNAYTMAPENKATITIEQARKLISKMAVKQTKDFYVVIRPAEALGTEAANALLKTLEEPGDKVHFVLITDSPSALLPTVLSRAELYFMRVKKDGDIHADAKIKALAKRLMVAKGADLVDLADEITKKKDNVRAYAMEIVGVAIEMLYKTYFITEKSAFLKKIPKFLQLYENLSQNGHVKLQIVSNLC